MSIYDLDYLLSLSREDILGSLGREYSNLSLHHLRTILAARLIELGLVKNFNNDSFWDTLGSVESTISQELSEQTVYILLQTSTDIDLIQSLYNSSSYARRLLNSEDFLKMIVNRIEDTLIPLPNWEYKEVVFDSDKGNYNTFLNWYNSNYYSSNCLHYNSPAVCYSGALANGDNEKASIIYRDIGKKKGIPFNDFRDLLNLPLDDALSLINLNKGILLWYLSLKEYNHLLGNDLSEDEIDELLKFVISNDNSLDDHYNIHAAIGYPDLFEHLYNHYGRLETSGYLFTSNSVLREENEVLDLWFINVLESLKRAGMGDYRIVRSDVWKKAMDNLIGSEIVIDRHTSNIIERMFELAVENEVIKDDINKVLHNLISHVDFTHYERGALELIERLKEKYRT